MTVVKDYLRWISYNLWLSWSCLPLRWRHNKKDGVSNHQPHDCLFNRLFGRRSKKTPKPRVTGLCAGNSPGTGEFPAQMASNAETVSIWWRHHAHRPFSCPVPYIYICSALGWGNGAKLKLPLHWKVSVFLILKLEVCAKCKISKRFGNWELGYRQIRFREIWVKGELRRMSCNETATRITVQTTVPTLGQRWVNYISVWVCIIHPTDPWTHGPDMNPFHQIFFIIIQIQWQFDFTTTPISTSVSIQYFAQVTTAHHECDEIIWIQMRGERN